MTSGKSNYDSGKWAESLVKDKLEWKIGRKVIRHTNYDSSGKESWQCVVVNGRNFICPDLEVYDLNLDLEMRVEVKSFLDFPRTNIPFKHKENLLIVSESQFRKYVRLQNEEEVPIFIVFVIPDGFRDTLFFWASLNDMVNRPPRKEGLYTWELSGVTEPCYFFRAKDFFTDIEKL